jgi:hypothetical protein
MGSRGCDPLGCKSHNGSQMSQGLLALEEGTPYISLILRMDKGMHYFIPINTDQLLNMWSIRNNHTINSKLGSLIVGNKDSGKTDVWIEVKNPLA